MSLDRLLDRDLLRRAFDLLAAGRGTPVYDHPNLRVLTTPAGHLLAMKARAARAARDADDLLGSGQCGVPNRRSPKSPRPGSM